MDKHTNAVKGVISDGFMTIVQPVARAGATFQDLDQDKILIHVKNRR